MGHLQGLPKLGTLRITKVGLRSPDPKTAAERAELLAEAIFSNFKRVESDGLSLVAFGEAPMLCYIAESSKTSQDDCKFHVVSRSQAEAVVEEPRSAILNIQLDLNGFLRVD